MAIEYIKEHVVGKVIVFIDNQSMMWSLLNVKPHSLFELSHQNSINLGSWLSMSGNNEVEFRWMPSHLGFSINELADKAAEAAPIGPFPFPKLTIASWIRENKASVVHEWRESWTPFANTKALMLKKKKKTLLPNAWDSKDKFFMKLAGDMVHYSQFTWLVSGHACSYRWILTVLLPRGASRLHMLCKISIPITPAHRVS